MKTLVLGIGNLLLGDEGVGVHVIEALRKKELPAGTELLDAGTAVLDAAEAIEQAERIIVVDAMKAGCGPGTVYRVPLCDCAAAPTIASLHGFDLGRVMALTGRATLPDTVVIGVEPQNFDWSMALSAPVQRALPAVIEAVEEELRDYSS